VRISLSIGSLVIAAALRKTGLTPAIVAISSRILAGHMHLIGKLIVVKLNFPLRIFLPTLFKISLPALLNLEDNSGSLRSKPP
jgi:hypothetical protein